MTNICQPAYEAEWWEQDYPTTTAYPTMPPYEPTTRGQENTTPREFYINWTAMGKTAPWGGK